MLRNILGVIAGCVAAFVIIMVAEMLNHWFYAIPTVDANDPEALAGLMASLPFGAFLIVYLAHLLGSFGGGFTAARIGATRPVMLALIVGTLLLAGGVLNLVMLPHPMWFYSELVFYLPAAWIGGRLGARRLG